MPENRPGSTEKDVPERKHHPDCPAPYFPDRTDRCRCMFMAMLDRAPRPIPPEGCDNYRPPLTCLTAPSSEAGRCDKCRVRVVPPGAGEANA